MPDFRIAIVIAIMCWRVWMEEDQHSWEEIDDDDVSSTEVMLQKK